MSKRWVGAAAVMGVVLGAGCGERAAEPWIVGSVGPHVQLHVEQTYLPPGASTRVTAVAYGESGERGEGTVRLASLAGSFAGGPQVELALVNGSVTTTYSCDATVDSRCTGIVALEASWGEHRIANTVNLSYQVLGGGGTSSGGGGGGSGAPAAARGIGDPNKVYLLETGISPVENLDHVVTSLETAPRATFYGEVVRPTDGAVVYITDPVYAVVVFVPDPLTFDESAGRWTLPVNLSVNDLLIDTPRCDIVDSLKLRPVSGVVVYSCAGQSSFWDLSDLSGSEVLTNDDVLLAAAPRLDLLVWRNATLRVGNRYDGFKEVTGFSGADSHFDFRAARWRRTGGGWWLVSVVGAETSPSLWRVTESGVASKVGRYPDTLGNLDSIVLDGDGNAYTIRRQTTDTGADYGVVLKFEPPPAATPTVVASDLDGSPTDLTQSPPHVRNVVLRGRLFTGP